jgi:hypothetical protein
MEISNNDRFKNISRDPGIDGLVWFMVFNATFNSFIGGGNRRRQPTCRKTK